MNVGAFDSKEKMKNILLNTNRNVSKNFLTMSKSDDVYQVSYPTFNAHQQLDEISVRKFSFGSNNYFVSDSESEKKNSIVTKQQSYLIRKFINKVKLIVICHNWCQWALLKYKTNINKYISFAQISSCTTTTNESNTLLASSLSTSSSSSSSSTSTSSSSSSTDEYHHSSNVDDTNRVDDNLKFIEAARVKVEMMNFNRNFLDSIRNFGSILDTKARQILINPACTRTDTDFDYLRLSFKKMTHLISINRLPADTQLKLFKSCWLEEYNEKRVIVAQEQRAEFFYYVINGSLVCTHHYNYVEQDTNVETTRSNTICFLEKGATYGDLPLLSHSTHTSNLVTRSNKVQLLVITRQDFFEIFVNTKCRPPVAILKKRFGRDAAATATAESKLDKSKIDSNTIENEISPTGTTNPNALFDMVIRENIEFLQQLSLFESWPLKQIERKPKSIKSCLFQRGQIVTDDSTMSKYIYIVKTGCVSVWAKIEMKNKKQQILQNDVSDDNRKNEKEKKHEIDYKDYEVSYFVRNRLLEEHHYEILNQDDALRVKDHDEINKEIESKMRLNHVMDYLRSVKGTEEFETKTTKTIDLTDDLHAVATSTTAAGGASGDGAGHNKLKKIEPSQAVKLPKILLKSTESSNKPDWTMTTRLKNNYNKLKLPDIKSNTTMGNTNGMPTKMLIESRYNNNTSNVQSNGTNQVMSNLNNSHVNYELDNSSYTKNSASITRPSFQANKFDPIKESNLILKNRRLKNSIKSNEESIKSETKTTTTRTSNNSSFLSSVLSIANSSAAANKSHQLISNRSIDYTLNYCGDAAADNNYDDDDGSNRVNYLLIKKLLPGDYFGLNDLLFNAQPSMQLISDGAECILLSKEFFVENSSIKYLKELRKLEIPYPRLEDIEENYIKHLNWKRFSKKILKSKLASTTTTAASTSNSKSKYTNKIRV